jgi:hypothetical protein
VKAHQEAAIEYARFPESTEDREKLITTAIELVKVLMTGDDGKRDGCNDRDRALGQMRSVRLVFDDSPMATRVLETIGRARQPGRDAYAAAFDLIKRKPFAYIFELAASRAVTEQISRKPASKPRRRAKKGRKR